MQLGFIGLGTMGLPMATNLVKAGHRVQTWNRSPEPVRKLAALGAEAAEAPAMAAQGVQVLVSILADDVSTRTVLLDGGVLAALGTGAIVVNMATVSVALAHEMAEKCAAKDLGYVAAPVLGRPTVAEAGELNILAAGARAAIDRAQPLFDVLGRKTWRFGEKPEAANAIKLAANFMLACAIESMGEAAALVSAYGTPGGEFLEMVTSTFFPGPAYKGYGNAIATGHVEPAGFKLVLGLKDIRLALEAAEAASVPMPFASILKDNLLDNMAHGEGRLDWAALARVAERRAGQR